MYSGKESIFYKHLKLLLAINILLSDKEVFNEIEDFCKLWFERNEV